MATGAASFTVFLNFLILFTLSSARTPLDLPGIDHANHDSFSESDKNPAAANTILLPSDKLDSEPATLIHWEPDSVDSKISKPDISTESSEASDPIPITVISFRPINRHIPRRPLPLSFRLGHRCRHNHRFKPWNPRLPRREIPYGNDMILNNVEDRSFDPLPHGGVRQIPARWMRFRHLEPRHSRETGMEKSDEMSRPHHHNHQHKREHEGHGLMKKIRKFLNQF